MGIELTNGKGKTGDIIKKIIIFWGVSGMTVLVVGADRLGKIPSKLQEEGAREIIHWSGRQKSCLNRTIPKKVDKIVLFWDFLNHNLMNNIKQQAKAAGIPVIFSKRSLIGKVS